MEETIVKDWLSEYKALSNAEIHSFANSINQNNDLIKAILTVLQDKKYYIEFLDSVCHQLFSFYRSREPFLQQFTLQCVPVLITLYLTAIPRGDKKSVKCVEVLLLGIYNLEVIDSAGVPVVYSFRIPSIAKPSLYHEPMSLSQSILTENALSKLEQGDTNRIAIGPYSEVEKINASNRLDVLTVVMRVYNQHITQLSSLSYHFLCKTCSKMVRQGYPRHSSWSSYNSESGTPHQPLQMPRIPLSSPFLQEMLHAVYFSMFNGAPSVGLQALDDIHFRASHDLLSDVLLVTNAIRNSLKVNPSGQPSDGPMGISISLSPSTSTTSMSKSIITNASFRTKKLPDDIPILQIKDELLSKDGSPLTSITEENDDPSRPPSAVTRKEKQRRGSTSSLGAVNAVASVLSKNPIMQIIKPPKKDSAIINGNVAKYSSTGKLKIVENTEGIEEVLEGADTLNTEEYELQSLGQAMSTASPDDEIDATSYPEDNIFASSAHEEGDSLHILNNSTSKVVFQPMSNHKFDSSFNTVV